MTTTAEQLIVVDNLEKRFNDKPVLRGVSFGINTGECSAILGRSGGGKTTLLRCLNLLEQPTSGSIVIDGDEIFGDGRRLTGKALVRLRQRVGLLFQSFHLFPHLTAAENVAIPLLRIAGMNDREALTTAFGLLDRVGLAHKGMALPATLSGGQQQRVAIARALALRPVTLLFDEPTSALDPESSNDVKTVMRALCADGITMVVVTHDLPFAEAVADHVMFVDGGLIVERGTPAAVLRSPTHSRTREFIQHIGA
jgi:ABC-type polar amino acid transport system ATPase subunit